MQISYKNLHELEYVGKKYWHFEAAMVTTCRPVFDDCDDNHEVERKLRRAKVIRKNNNTDSEVCALVIRFSSRKSGEHFIDRLNKYLKEQE